ncbi:hypothetical protein Clow_01320 [Corynebacterium lowii]|uniref:Uncharacterized protein n=1 Tax=Corynebacterium lowii TaxID=1544413 RepID=A0A0Q0UET5_9CORY|nr:hypothetical protein Clow_01320 [Corynebacterium lowii]MDP9850885.1 hypothetical protein [Corynebacterium lowii]
MGEGWGSYRTLTIALFLIDSARSGTRYPVCLQGAPAMFSFQHVASACSPGTWLSVQPQHTAPVRGPTRRPSVPLTAPPAVLRATRKHYTVSL